ncbi:hypothetical protein [Tenacibaculum sp. C7A-26P2]|uniref:hypothetical protein n=1 Tax=Tenacibaculum sp. C7A-26P2 TaxID=3447504 RepID=UPI003F873630
MITREELKEIGFKELSHFAIGNPLNYNFSRGRFLSISCIGTPNEMMVIGQKDDDASNEVTDLVVLHNWDYDNFLKIDKVKSIIKILR